MLRDATLLYAVLAKAKADLGANLTHNIVNNAGAGNGLAATLKAKIGGTINWQNYLDNNNNLLAGNRIEQHLVRPDAGANQVTARGWLAY